MKDLYITAARVTFTVAEGKRKTATQERVAAKVKTVKAGYLVKIADSDQVDELLKLKAIRRPVAGEIAKTEDGAMVQVGARGGLSDVPEIEKVVNSVSQGSGSGEQQTTPKAQTPTGGVATGESTNTTQEKDALLARAKELKVRGASANWPVATLSAKIAEAEAAEAEERAAEKAKADADAAAGNHEGENDDGDDASTVV